MFEAVKFCRKSSDQVTERFPKNAAGLKIRRVNCKKKSLKINFRNEVRKCNFKRTVFQNFTMLHQ